MSIGDEVELDITNKRNPQFHRKFMALIKLAFDNQDNYKEMNDLRYDLTKAAGFYEERPNHITGEVEIKATSISFSSMDENEFEEVYNAVLDVVWKYLGASKEDVINQLIGF